VVRGIRLFIELSRTGTPVHRLQPPAPSRAFPDCHRPADSSPFQTNDATVAGNACRWPRSEKMPLSNRCNRLHCQNGHPLDPSIHGRGDRSPSDRRRRLAPPPCELPRVRAARSCGWRNAVDAVAPFHHRLAPGATSAPSRGAVGAAAASRVHHPDVPAPLALASFTVGAGPSTRPGSKPAPAYSAETQARRDCPLTLPVALAGHQRFQFPASTEAPFHAGAPSPPLPRAEAPSADESLPLRARLREPWAEPPLVLPALPPRPSFRHAFTSSLARSR
jgi:hypothetical protein